MIFISTVLILLVGVAVWKSTKREGFEDAYNEESCLALAKKNDERITNIKKKLQGALDIQSDVSNLKTQCDVITQNISKTIEMCQK